MRDDIVDKVVEHLGRLRVGEGRARRAMAVFPVFDGNGATRPVLEYRTLGEAIAQGIVEVTERASASVPELVLRNRGRGLVLVLDGEEIVGGKQNRIANASFLVGAGSEVVLPVSCVEHGRWHDVAPAFAAGDAPYPSLRAAKAAQVQASLQATGRHQADQGAIWNHIALKQQEMSAASPTGAMHDIYRSKEEDLAGYAQAFPYVAGAVGFVIALGGQVVGADLFDQPRTAAVLWGKLLRSYALDALGRPSQPAAREEAARFLSRTEAVRGEVYPSLALGEDVRLSDEGVIGSALVYQGVVVHAGLFRTEGRAEEQDAGTRLVRASTRRQFRTGGWSRL